MIHPVVPSRSMRTFPGMGPSLTPIEWVVFWRATLDPTSEVPGVGEGRFRGSAFLFERNLNSDRETGWSVSQIEMEGASQNPISRSGWPTGEVSSG